MVLYACGVLLPVQDSIPVEVDTLAVVDIPVVVEGNLAEEDSLVVDNLEMASATLLYRIVVARADQD